MSVKELILCGGADCRVRVTDENGAVALVISNSSLGIKALFGRDEQHMLMLFLQERLARK